LQLEKKAGAPDRIQQSTGRLNFSELRRKMPRLIPLVYRFRFQFLNERVLFREVKRELKELVLTVADSFVGEKMGHFELGPALFHAVRDVLGRMTGSPLANSDLPQTPTAASN
jgi:hypothetical protein